MIGAKTLFTIRTIFLPRCCPVGWLTGHDFQQTPEARRFRHDLSSEVYDHFTAVGYRLICCSDAYRSTAVSGISRVRQKTARWVIPHKFIQVLCLVLTFCEHSNPVTLFEGFQGQVAGQLSGAVSAFAEHVEIHLASVNRH